MLILFYILNLSLNCELKFVNKEVKLMKVILKNDTKKALEIINSNKEINLNEEIRGLSPFKASILNMDKELLEALIEKGIDINGYDENGNPSFIILLNIVKRNLKEKELNKVLEIFKFFLNKGVNLHLKFKDGSTILHYLVEHQEKEVLEFLIKNKVDMNVVDDKNNDSLLHIVVRTKDDNLEILKMLIPEVNINLQNKLGMSALYISVLRNDIEAVKLLLESGADINLKDKATCNALHRAALEGDVRMVKLLIEKGADINSIDKDNNTPLHYACLLFRFRVMELLINKGADINIKNSDGNTPLGVLEEFKKNLLDALSGKYNPERNKESIQEKSKEENKK